MSQKNLKGRRRSRSITRLNIENACTFWHFSSWECSTTMVTSWYNQVHKTWPRSLTKQTKSVTSSLRSLAQSSPPICYLGSLYFLYFWIKWAYLIFKTIWHERIIATRIVFRKVRLSTSYGFVIGHADLAFWMCLLAYFWVWIWLTIWYILKSVSDVSLFWIFVRI